MDSQPLQVQPAVNDSRSKIAVQDWIVRRLAEELRVEPGSLKIDRAIMSFGIDSVQIVSVTSELEDWGGFRFPGNPLEECSTIEELAQYSEKLMHEGK